MDTQLIYSASSKLHNYILNFEHILASSKL